MAAVPRPVSVPDARHTGAGGHKPFAVLVVAYRAVDLLESCLFSLHRYMPGCEVHVWDNSGSDSADVRTFAESHPEVNWYLGGENIGFAAAVNRLAEKVPGHDMLLINPDAELVSPLAMTLAAIREPGVAAAGPMAAGSELSECRRVSRWERRHAPWDGIAYRKLTLLKFFGGAAGLSTRFRDSCVSYQFRAQPSDVDGFLAGSCLAINRAAWDAVGQFDEAFFLYQEEAEWQRRAISAGWRLQLADEIGIRHRSKGTVAAEPERLTRSEDLAFASTVLLVEHWYGTAAAELYLVFSIVLENLRRRMRELPCSSTTGSVVVVPIDGSAERMKERAAEARALVEAGYSVCAVSLQPLGSLLPAEIPSNVRLIRRPWWWPSIAPATPRAIAHGDGRRMRAFTVLFKLRHRHVRVLAVEELLRASRPTDDGGGVGSDIDLWTRR